MWLNKLLRKLFTYKYRGWRIWRWNSPTNHQRLVSPIASIILRNPGDSKLLADSIRKNRRNPNGVRVPIKFSDDTNERIRKFKEDN